MIISSSKLTCVKHIFLSLIFLEFVIDHDIMMKGVLIPNFAY